MTEYQKLVPSDLVDAARFKAAMRCVASSVTVITSGTGSATNGMTATAVCSVSAEPPSILVVINSSNRTHTLIEGTGAFAVNVLSESQSSLARHFASKPLVALGEVAHHAGVTGVPILDGSAAHVECVVESQTRSGTHSVFFGRVVSSREGVNRPLLYWQGQFMRLVESSSSY